MKPFSLNDFIAESNKIEQIDTVTSSDIEAHENFLLHPVSVESLVMFVGMVAQAQLRDRVGMDVWVGDYQPILGGPYVRMRLEDILNESMSPYTTHQSYESLHPFMDGNGRSGRVLWLHMMGGIHHVPLGFLHTWYYMSLENNIGGRLERTR